MRRTWPLVRTLFAAVLGVVLYSCGSATTPSPAPDPYLVQLQAIANKIESAGTTPATVSGLEAQQAVVAVYGPDTKPSFVTTKVALRVIWTARLTAAFNGPNPATELNPFVLIRFSDSATSALGGRFWVPIDAVLRSPGVAEGPATVKNVLALPTLPSYVGLGGAFPSGSVVYVGQAAANVWGKGGAVQVFVAKGAGAATSISYAAYVKLVASQPF